LTSDGRRALSATKVYRASDGMLLGSLPAGAGVQAISGGVLQTVDLTKL
jgi:hypothetical protein